MKEIKQKIFEKNLRDYIASYFYDVSHNKLKIEKKSEKRNDV